MPNKLRPIFVAPPHNIVSYEHGNPSPHFSNEQIAYINSIRLFLSETEINHLKGIDEFAVNLNVEGMADGGLPGLRAKDGVDTIWVRKFTEIDLNSFSCQFLEPYPAWFPESEKYKCIIPLFRIVTPDGGRFYPFEFHGNLDIWRKRIEESATRHQTLLGHFDRGKLTLSNGDIYGLCLLNFDKIKGNAVPSDW